MKTRFYLFLLIFVSFNWGKAQQTIDVKHERQLFLDSYIIENLDQVEMVLHQPKNEGPVLTFDNEWEGHFSGYTTIIHDDVYYRAYYRGLRDASAHGGAEETTCVALSIDGIHWKKPNLGLFEISGNRDNNVVLANEDWVTHNFSPFIDKNPGVNPNEKYKAIGGHIREGGLFIYTSPDGFRWERYHPDPVITEGPFDSQNVAFWSESEQQYICYFRTLRDGFRSVSRATSKDLIHWTDPVIMEFGNTPLEHLYTQQTSPYFRAPQIYVAIGARFMPNRQVLTDQQAEELNVNPKYFKDCSDAIIMTSRGGNQYDRTFMESYIKPGIGLQNWVSRSNYPALNVVRTGETEMSVYVNENYAQPTAHLKRYSMRLDGFASLEADYNGGMVLTKPFTFEGKELEINYSTSAAGSIKIALLDEDGNEIPGFGMEDCQEIIGNEVKRVLSWGGNRDLSRLEGKTIQLKINMKDANLYSFKFNE
ncbi:hypothetical protein [Membranihabitans maritimus]|uniref:hypothetical protein n=1 Tax=Membranihabitans maritimus TaxID=2904244 RepID=UPI001F223DBE|nr:hypothetical protein [Membranihabitans maritimus]